MNSFLSSSEKVLRCCIDSKEDSLSLQQQLMQYPQDIIKHICQVLEPHILELLTHQYGSYILQRLASRDSDIAEKIIKCCKGNLISIMHNNYGSRVLEHMLKLDTGFRRYLGKFFTDLPEVGIKSKPFTHVVVACIRYSTENSELGFVVRILKSHPGLIWRKRFLKILVNYSQLCTCDQLDELFNRAMVESYLISYLNIKVGAILIATIVVRGHLKTVYAIQAAIRTKASCLLMANSFTLLISNLFEKPGIVAAQKIRESLALLDISQIRTLQTSSQSRQSYFDLTLRVLEASKSSRLNNFLSREDIESYF